MSALTRLPEHVAHFGIYRPLEPLLAEPKGQDGKRYDAWMHAIERARIEIGLRQPPPTRQAFQDSQSIARNGVRTSDLVTRGAAAPQSDPAESLATRAGARKHWYDDDSAGSQWLGSGTPAEMVRALAELANLISIEAVCASSSKTSELRPQGYVPEPLRLCWQWREDDGHEGMQLWLGVDRERLAELPKIIDFLRRSLEASGEHLCSLVCNGKERLSTSAVRARKSAQRTDSEPPQSSGAQSLREMTYVG